MAMDIAAPETAGQVFRWSTNLTRFHLSGDVGNAQELLWMALSASTSAVTPASASAGKASGAVFVASFWSPTRAGTAALQELLWMARLPPRL